MSKQTTVFPSASDVAAPAGAEEWRELYPYYEVFQPSLREEDDKKFWFCNSQHWPVPLRPFDCMMLEYSAKTLGQYNTRHLLVPPANGVECRMLNGYVYLSMVPVDSSEIESRIPQFLERAGHYFANWDELLANWKIKVHAAIEELEAVTFTALPDVVPLDWIKSGKGLDNTTDLLENFDKAMNIYHRIWQYHFEFLNLGYAAYLDFFTFLKGELPSIPDQAIATMVQGVESDLFRPDDELKTLAKLAIELDVAKAVKTGGVDEMLSAVASAPGGEKWIARWEEAKNPWFNFALGSGLLSTDKRWIDHLDIPLGYLRDYIEQLEAGEIIKRPTEELLLERDRITSEYRDLMDADVQAVFDEKLGLSRTVFPYVEDHNFYIEHWSIGVFWRKMRELSMLLSEAGFWPDADGMFFVKRTELRDVLWDYCNSWATGTRPIGCGVWPEIVEKRRKILDILAEHTPVPALNNPPETITEPFTVMLWGVTTEAVNKWAGVEEGDDNLSGMPASPGVIEGVARVLRSSDQLSELQKGEILVTPVTAPSWAPVFGKIGAAVTDIGGMMSHAAIVCREYGLPAVTGTGFASTRIKTGMRLRVDGTAGTVTILE